MKINKDFPRKIFLDKRVLVNGIKKNNVNYENHIELSQWIQDLINLGEITINVCDNIIGKGSEEEPFCIEETPITATDSTSLNFTVNGLNNHTITGEVKISATSGNQVSINSDGIYVPTPSFSQTPLTVNDSTTIDFTASGSNNHTLTGSVIISALVSSDLNNNLILGNDGKLYINIPASSQTPITANDSSRIDFTVSGTNNHTITANIIMSALLSNQLGNDLILGSDGNLFLDYTTTTDALDIRIDTLETTVVDLQNQLNIFNTRLDIIENAIVLINERLDECCTPVTLDVDFSGSTIDICFQDSSPGKLFGTLYLVGTGTDFGSFDGTTMATIYISDATGGNTTKVVGYSPKKTGLTPSYDIQLLSGQGDPINTAIGGNTRTISFTTRFFDTASILHFVTITANIPLLNNTDCSNGISTTSSIDNI